MTQNYDNESDAEYIKSSFAIWKHKPHFFHFSDFFLQSVALGGGGEAPLRKGELFHLFFLFLE